LGKQWGRVVKGGGTKEKKRSKTTLGKRSHRSKRGTEMKTERKQNEKKLGGTGKRNLGGARGGKKTK